MTTDYPVPRPASEQLVDLHVYLLPREEWSEKYSSTYIESIDKALSAGFVRVWPDLTVSGLRLLIEEELEHDILPQSYVFLRSVGSRMTQIKPKQELELKCKAFLPPTAWAPEIVVLEVPRDSMSVPVYRSFPGYSPRHNATQPINGIPTHFPQVANHDRMGQQDGLDEGNKKALETIQKKAQDKRKKAKSKDQNLAKDGKASRLAKKGEANAVVGNKKIAGMKAPQSKAGPERTKRLKQTQAAWSKEAKRPKLSQAQEKEKSSLGSVRDRNDVSRKVQEKEKSSLGSVRDRNDRARKVETGLEKERNVGGGRGQIKAMRKTYNDGGRRGGKIGHESLGTIPRPQGKVIEVLPAIDIKADRLGRLQQDRTVQTSGINIGMIVPSQHNTHSTLVTGDSPTMPPASIPAPMGQRLPPSSNYYPNPPHPPHPYHTQNANLTHNSLDSAHHSSNNHRVANPDDTSRHSDNSNTSANNSASFNTVQPLPHIAHNPDLLVVKSHSRSHPGQSTLENSKISHPISSHSADPSNTLSNSDDDTNQVADVASPTNNRTTNNSLREDVDQDTTPATSDHHHTINLHHHHHNIHQSGSRRLSYNDSSSVPFPAPLSATPPDTPTSDTPPPGQSPMMQQQQGYKSDPLQSMVGNPGKSGRPDAYTNNTNEDSGIAEPTPEDDDPDYERRKSDIDDQYYNQLHPNQTQNGQFPHGYQEKELEEKRQRQAEIQEKEEERRKEEERIQSEKQREEERREHKRKLEQKKQEDVKKQRQREMEKKWEDERRKEEAKMREEKERKEEEEERQRSIAERDRASAFDGATPLEDGDEDYDDAGITMETNQALDSRGHFLNDEQMKRRAEDELRDYEPQSTWKRDGEGGGEMSHLGHPGRRSRSREDTEMEMASQQAVQDGLKRVHLTPEIHRKAKIGKIRNSSITDEEDIYETDPEMSDLMEQLQIARQERMKKEKERENLIKKARDLQTKTYERRNRSYNETRPRSSSITPDEATHPRDYWKKRYYDEKKKTPPFEDQISRMRNQLELMHRKLLNHIEGKKKGAKVKGPPSKENDHKINILKMQHEMDELRRKVDNSRMKLTSEIKLRIQAEAEVRGLKSEVTQRKINMTLIRNQKLAALKTGDKNLLSKTPIPALGQGHMSMSAKR